MMAIFLNSKRFEINATSNLFKEEISSGISETPNLLKTAWAGTLFFFKCEEQVRQMYCFPLVRGVSVETTTLAKSSSKSHKHFEALDRSFIQ